MLGMDAEPGIYLRTLSDLFQAIEETRGRADCSVSISYLEVSTRAPQLIVRAKPPHFPQTPAACGTLIPQGTRDRSEGAKS